MTQITTILNCIITTLIALTLLLYIFKFFENDIKFQFITIYISISLIIRLFSIFTPENLQFMDWFLLVQSYTIIGIYNLLLKRKYLKYLAIFLTIITIISYNTIDLESMLVLQVFIAFLIVLITTSDYNKTFKNKENKPLYFFNYATRFYVISAIFIFIIFSSLSSLFKSDLYLQFIEPSISIIEFIFFGILIKEWELTNKTTILKSIVKKQLK